MKHKFCQLYSALFLLSISSLIPLKLAIAHSQTPIPQAILTLGGGADREKFTAQFAQFHPSLTIWISSGSPRLQARQIFQDANISASKVNLDYRATDTVSNFTSLVKDFQRQNYQHIYLITSDFHMPRAKAIAFIVLGSHGIAYTPVAIPTQKESESKLKIVRDSIRAVVWLITGRSGSSLNRSSHIIIHHLSGCSMLAR